MDVIRHPHIGMNGEAKPSSRFDQGVSKELVIRFSGKDRLTVIAALDDVLGLAGEDVARKVSVGETCLKRREVQC